MSCLCHELILVRDYTVVNYYYEFMMNCSYLYKGFESIRNTEALMLKRLSDSLVYKEQALDLRCFDCSLFYQALCLLLNEL